MVIWILRHFDGTDRQIDAFFYELYGLAEEEIATAEEDAW